jgi:hypothetical protein
MRSNFSLFSFFVVISFSAVSCQKPEIPQETSRTETDPTDQNTSLEAKLSPEAAYQSRNDWSMSRGDLNLSSYLFFDLNENGILDLGDRPLANIAVALRQGENEITVSRSNINGFANFSASSTYANAPLHEPGLYEFVVLVPPGWFTTTNNVDQERELISMPGSNCGVAFMGDMLKPVGLAPTTFIRGTYSGNAAAEVSLTHEGKVIASKLLAPEERFSWPADTGHYVLKSGDFTHNVNVDFYPVDIGSIGSEMPSTATPRRADFEDVVSTGLRKVANGYHGLNWFNLNAMRNDFSNGGSGYTNGTTSGCYILYTSSGHPCEISNDQPFDFLQVNLTNAWPAADGQSMVVEYFRGDDKVREDRVPLSSLCPVTYQPKIANVTKVRMVPEHYWQVVLDDLVVSGEK